MQTTIDAILVAGFLLTDFLMFHDLLKAGEQYTTVEYLVGALSILVIFNSLASLLSGHRNAGQLG